MPVVEQIYLACGVIGFLYITGTAFLGIMELGQDTGLDGADLGGSDGSGSSSDGDFGCSDGGDGGSADSGDLAELSSSANQLLKASAASFRTGMIGHPRHQSHWLILLRLVSPSTISTFMFFFGLSGALILSVFPMIGWLSVIPAGVFGITGYNAMSLFTRMLVKKMRVNTAYASEDLIGRMAEVTVPIVPGKLGEITYKAGGGRDTSPARCRDRFCKFSRMDKVMIADVKDGIFIVEPWQYQFDETDGQEAAEQKLRNS